MEKKTPFLVKAYETGGIPLVLMVVGAAMALEAGFDWYPSESPALPPREVFLMGIGLILAGAVCWTFIVYMLQQREAEKLRVIEAVVEAATNQCDPDTFFASAADFLSAVDFRKTVTDPEVARANGGEPPESGEPAQGGTKHA